jgi:long-chain acyl-CoA synthetase
LNFIKDYNKTAIIYGETSINYKELIGYSKSYSSLININREDRVIIYMENRPEHIYSFFSIWDKKGTAICLDATFTSSELDYYFLDSNPKYIFTSEKNKLNTLEALNRIGSNTPVIVVDNIENTYSGNDYTIQPPEKEDTCLILYTSGTTGNPKGVMLTFDNLLINIEGLDSQKVYLPEDRFLGLLPLHHIFSIIGTAIIPLSKGATLIFLTELSPENMVKALKEHKITVMLGVPRIWEAMLRKILLKINSSIISKSVFKIAKLINNKAFSKIVFKKVHDEFGGHLRFFVSGGSKLNGQIAKSFLTLGIEILEGYGLTETAPMIAFTHPNNVIPGCAGKLLPGIETVIAEDGEILVRGRNVMKGYYNKPEATAEAIDDKGWFHTGDLGTLKGENLYITGRKKEMIVLSNGKNINPVEIEDWIIFNSNLVNEVAVVEYDSKLTAIIYPNFQKVHEEGINNIIETLKWGVIDTYNHTVPLYKKILVIKILQVELPKTKLGKIRRFMIPELLNEVEQESVVHSEPTYQEYIELKEFLSLLKEKKISPNAHLELDLSLDSLDITELFAYIENNYGVIVEQTLITQYPTVEKLSEYLKSNNNTDIIKNSDKNWSSELNSVSNIKIKNSCLPFLIGFLCKPLFWFYIKQNLSGKETLVDTPSIYVGNHQSFLDVFLINNVIPKFLLHKGFYIAKIKYFKNPLMKFAATHSNIILLDINSNVREALKEAARVLKSGGSIILFPEGVRSRDGKIREFKKSFAILSKELNIPITPFGIKGAYSLLSPTDKFLKSGTVDFKFFPRIYPETLSVEEIVEKTHSTIKSWVE